ncbi:MAG TPA: T9SS type A sorting domain-containing protein [Chryseolinea sp.]|nr:T9SS type A sorting domain-containing protein [Chryseolinea sp.]
MKNLKKALLLSLAVVSVFYCRGDQFNISNGDIAALKAAIIVSNSNNKPDTIHLAPFGTYRFTTVDNNFLGDNALPLFDRDGSDANSLTFLGNGATLMRDNSIAVLRLLYFSGCNVILYNTNLIGGSTLPNGNGDGGAIKISGARVALYNCLLKGNQAPSGGAVAISSTYGFTAKNCTFTDNVATQGTGSAIHTYSGTTALENCVVVNNSCWNVNLPAAIYNVFTVNANTSTDNIYLKNCIVAKNTYDNPASPDNGKEFDLSGAVYTDGGNLIGSYPVVAQISFPTFRQGQPSANNDYVGTEAVPIDPLLGTLGDHGLFTDFYDLLPGSKALLNGAGIKNAGIPAVASNGIVPAEAYPGDMITLTGVNLSAIDKVQFSGSPAVTTGITTTSRAITVSVHPNARTGQILLMDAVPHFIFTIQTFKVKTITTPVAPSNLEGIGASTSSIALTWDDVADEDNYRIEYKKSQGGSYIVLETIDADVTSYTAGNLVCSETYDFRVIALGRGTQSVPASVTQVTPLPLDAPVLTPPSSTEGCTGGSITIAAPTGFAAYHWNTGETTETINAQDSGDYSVKVTDVNGCVSDFSSPVAITFYNYPDTAVNQTGNILLTPVVADKYQWYHDNNPITDETTNSLTVRQDGVYRLELGNHGCTSSSREIAVVASGITGVKEETSEWVSVFPNPATEKFIVRVPTHVGEYQIMISDPVGKIIYQHSGNGETQVEIPGVKKSLYLLVIESDGEILTQKIVFN